MMMMRIWMMGLTRFWERIGTLGVISRGELMHLGWGLEQGVVMEKARVE
jgi:hypothetical protein